MKKHPVDDLFGKKLSTLERQPSSDTWARISANTNKPERKLFPGWVWYTAASVALALIAGYSLWENERPASSTELSHRISKTSPVKITDPDEKAVVAVVPDTPAKKAEGVDPTRLQRAKSTAVKIQEEHQEQAVFTREKITLPENDNSVPVSVADTPAEVQVASVQPSAIKEVQPMAMPEVKSTNRTIVVNVTAENDSLEQPKASRFTRVFRQLKNVRAGEPVNWDEVGFNPRAVIARVDGKHKQGQ